MVNVIGRKDNYEISYSVIETEEFGDVIRVS